MDRCLLLHFNRMVRSLLHDNLVQLMEYLDAISLVSIALAQSIPDLILEREILILLC